MTVNPLGAGLCGAVLGLGLWLLAARATTSVIATGRVDRRTIRLVAIASGAGLVVGIAVGIPILTLLAAGFGWLVADATRGPSVPEVTRTGEAIATWAETIRQELEAGSPLVAAVARSTDGPPAAIAEPLRRLAVRLDDQPLPRALWELRAEIDHAALGPVIAALDIGYRRGAGDLPRLMASQVTATRHRVGVLRDLHAARAKHRRAMVLLLGLFGVSVAVLLAVWPAFLAAYRPATGELVLGGIGLTVLAAVRALVRMSQPALPPDFFAAPPRLVDPSGISR